MVNIGVEAMRAGPLFSPKTCEWRGGAVTWAADSVFDFHHAEVKYFSQQSSPGINMVNAIVRELAQEMPFAVLTCIVEIVSSCFIQLPASSIAVALEVGTLS